MTDRPTAAPDGVLRWPADPAFFVDTTRCPACFAPLPSPRCAACGLDLGVPASVELLEVGTRLHAESVSRAALIARMRAAQAVPTVSVATQQAAARPPQAGTTAPSADAPATGAPAAAVTATAAAVATAPPAVPSPAAPAAPVPSAPPASPTPAAAPFVAPPAAVPPASVPPASADDHRPRRSGVQVFLLGLGVVLLSITAIVFLFYAYLVTSLEVRSIITAVLSVAVLGIAWLLRARRLPGTAEGVASVAVVLLLLDVWIVRANGLFGTDALDAVGYTGGALLVVAALLALARRVTGIRTTGFVAAALLPVATYLLATQLAPEGDVPTGVWAGSLAVAVLGAAGAVLPPLVERTILLVAGFTGGGVAVLTAAWAMPELAWHPLWGFLGAAAAWLLLVIVLGARAGAVAPMWRLVAASAFGLSAALAPAVSIALEIESGTAIWLAPAVTGAVLCLFAVVLRRSGVRPGAELCAFLGAALVAVGSALPGALVGLAAIGARFVAGIPAPGLGRGGPLGLDAATELGAVLLPVVVALGSAATLAILGRLRRFVALPVGAALAAVVVVGAVVEAPWVTATIWPAVALGALAWAGFARPASEALLAVLAVAGVAAAVLAVTFGFTAPDVWPVTSGAVLLAAVGGRVLSGRIWGARATAIGLVHVVVAGLLTIAVLASLAWWLESRGVRFDEPSTAPWLILGIGSSVLLGVAGLVRLGTTGDRIALTVPLLGSAVVAAAAFALDAPDATWSWLPASLLAAASVPWLRRSAPSGVRIAVAAIAPLALGAASGLLALDLAGRDTVAYAVAGAALAAAALAHLARRGRGDAAMIGWSVAVAILGLAAITWAVAGASEPWLVFAILAPVPIVLAALAGDPIAGESPQRHVAWLTAVLAVAAVWSRLLGDGVDTVEAYTLPLAAALIACGLLIAWRRAPVGSTSRGRTALFSVAAGVAVLPSVGSAGDSELRTLVLVAAGAIVALAAGFLPQSLRGVPVRLIGVATGWTAVTGAALVRGLSVARTGDGVLPPEFWPVIALACGVVITVVWARTESRPEQLAEVGLAASLAVASLPTVLAIVSGDESSLRAAVLFTVVGAAHVAGAATRARPFAGPVFAWTTRGILVLGGVLALVSATVDPFDLVTAPIGLAFVAAGAVALRRSPGLGSWPALGTGLAILLVPPLLADFLDPELWRNVALGVVALATLLAGVVRRLQAPFVLGGGVLLVHAIVQLWPAITWLYEAVWWWLWLGIAGVLLVVLAATYERQLRLARSTISSIGALR
ncbi:SCO7613 C-terminal domain-containing membrane protein [Agromyces sp. NPDC058064]|uniref:SCO7613 C-terminal domain-containing membrane protein n=1 Tax=Agromyces sp. NPDC058064 TaxID=3346322 RepID=UPI0036DA6547